MYRGQEQDEAEVTEKGFDLVVTRRHPKTGLIVSSDPYTLRTVKSGDGKMFLYERPAGSGNLWNKQGEAVGRWDKTKPEGERFMDKAAHVAWVPPETADQKLARSVVEKDAKIAELEKEMAAIRAEAKKKDKGA